MSTELLVRSISPAEATELRADLVELLVDSVEHGASVNFIQPMTTTKAEAWWDAALASHARGERLIFVAEAAGLTIGTAQLVFAGPENQSFRADVAKLIVHSAWRRTGAARALMAALEDEARAAGRTLLTLDTESGSAAEILYLNLGWTKLGEIPGYALSADGSARANCSFFYKELS